MDLTDRRRPPLVTGRVARRRRVIGGCRPVLAGERSGGYDGSPVEEAPGGEGAADEPGTAGGEAAGGGDGGAPFGLPVLGELAGLAGVLERLRVADGALLDAVAGLAELLADDTVERTTGVGIEHWLAVVAAQTRLDRRLLLRACRLLERLPNLRDAVVGHRISFAQLRGVTIGLRGARRELDQDLDRLLGVMLDELDRFDHPDPDVLVRQLVDALDELDPHDLAERERNATAGRYLHLQPRLDGTGARLSGELDATATALLDAATTPTIDAVTTAGSYGAARLDLLLARLTTTTPPDTTGTDGPIGTAGAGEGAGTAGPGGEIGTTGGGSETTGTASGPGVRHARHGRRARR